MRHLIEAEADREKLGRATEVDLWQQVRETAALRGFALGVIVGLTPWAALLALAAIQAAL